MKNKFIKQTHPGGMRREKGDKVISALEKRKDWDIRKSEIEKKYE